MNKTVQWIMKQNRDVIVVSLLSLALMACDSKKPEAPEKADVKPPEVAVEKADVLPYLNIQEQPAKIALPFCERKNCIDIDIQTLNTVDPWMNTWIAKQQALVIQDQIGLKQDMTLQQAVNAFVKKSDAWQAELKINKAYTLSLYTRIPYQRNEFVLMQIGVDTEQEGISVKDRYYFYVADRRSQKNLKILDVINSKQQVNMDNIVQDAYKKWLKDNTKDVQQQAPQKLYWGQADWFFDQQGIGLHYRGDEIVKEAKQLDIYLSKEQTQQVLKADVYQHMF